jgi:ParB-like chromosome segregation protein Spo0J
MTQLLTTINSEKIFGVELIELGKLKPHEEADSEHLRKLKEEIKSDGILKFAVTVSKNENIIIDGHHRVAALKELGCAIIPAVFVDYNSSNIEVLSWKDDKQLKKEDIIKAGLSLKKLPPKTSKHMIKIGGVLNHISAIEKRVNIPLEALGKER